MFFDGNDRVIYCFAFLSIFLGTKASGSSEIWVLVQVIVSGKLRAQRAKSMKFKDGYMISSGQPVNEYIDSAVRHVLLRQVRRPSSNPHCTLPYFFFLRIMCELVIAPSCQANNW